MAPESGRRVSRSQSSRLFCIVLRHGFLRRSTCSPTNNTVSICNYNVLKLIHEDHSARVVGEGSVEHTQLSGRQCTENFTHLIRSITISEYMIIAATGHAVNKNEAKTTCVMTKSEAMTVDVSTQVRKLCECKALSSTFTELTVLPRRDFS